MAEIKGNRPKKSNRLYITIFVLGIALAGVVIWQFYKYRIANKGINNMVSVKSKGLYAIQYDNLVIDEVGGSLHVKNVEMLPDTSVFNQMVMDKHNPAFLIRLNIPSLELAGIKTPKALLKKQIEGRIVHIESPTIEIELNNFLKDTIVYHPGKDLYKQLLGNLLSISVDSVEVTHANLIVKNRGSKTNLFSGKNVSLTLTDILIDSLQRDDSSRILFAKNLELNCEELILAAKTNDYKLNIQHFQFLSRNNSFSVGRITLQPQLGEEEFARHAKLQKDRYNFLLEGIRLIHFDREGLWHKRLIADELLITKSSFKIYRDLSYPRDTLSRVGKYPQQELMRLPFPLLIRKITLPESFIEYKEKNAKSDTSGKVQFYSVRATVANATNIKSAIAIDNKCVVHFNASFLHKAPIRANLVLLLRDPKGKFFISGNLGSLDAPVLNSLTQPMGLAKLEKGHINELRFNFSGNDSNSKGKITLLYSDLKVSLLKKDKEKDTYRKKFLPSLAAGILIKDSNPGSDKKIRTADMHYDRNINKSFFNLLWKSIFTGVKKNVGM